MSSCCFCGRLQGGTFKNEGSTFYTFPKENPTLAIWMEFAKKCSTEVKPDSVVCSAHFTQYCFENISQSVYLKKLAVPTIMIQNVENTKSIYPEMLMPFDQYKQKRDLDNELCENNDLQYIFSHSSNEHYVKITDSVSSMEGVDSIISFDNLDNNISIEDNHLNNFIIKKPHTMKPEIKNQKVDNVCEPASNNPPRTLIGKRKIINSVLQMNLKNKRIKYLTQKVQCRRKMISSLQNIITTLKNNNLFQDRADNV